MESIITIRKATGSDTSSLLQLKKVLLDFYAEATGELEQNYFSAKKKYIRDSIKSDIFLLAENNAEIIGMIKISKKHSVYMDEPSYYAILSDLVVLEHMRNHGVGKMLLREAINYCKESRCKSIKLTVKNFNGKAIDKYLSEGFKIQSHNMVLNIRDK